MSYAQKNLALSQNRPPQLDIGEIYRVKKEGTRLNESLIHTFKVISGPHGADNRFYKVMMDGETRSQLYKYDKVIKTAILIDNMMGEPRYPDDSYWTI